MDSLLCKFRGCLMGALIGDCLGAPFEAVNVVKTSKVLQYIQTVKSSDETGNLNVACRNLDQHYRFGTYIDTEFYTDDTAMTWALTNSLIQFPEFNASHLAASFTEAYFKEPNRGYGVNVIEVFNKLKHNSDSLSDVYQPAREQFDGSGSYGNGGAMRIAPVALLYNQNYNRMFEVAKKSTQLTHSNANGYNGALLQCLAVWLAFRERVNSNLDAVEFINKLNDRCSSISTDESCPFVKKLALLKKLTLDDEVENKIIVDNLGNGIAAANSVVTATYAFLRASRPISFLPIDNPFERTIVYAVTLGGDTDTIASMAGAIAGAFYGVQSIPKELQKCCENYNKALELADQLYEVYKR
ncbi:ADP-ribose glycohydrolase ARH3 [Chamberlinius hualienensis]